MTAVLKEGIVLCTHTSISSSACRALPAFIALVCLGFPSLFVNSTCFSHHSCPVPKHSLVLPLNEAVVEIHQGGVPNITRKYKMNRLLTNAVKSVTERHLGFGSRGTSSV
jgi:hypothetical protein